MEGLNYFDLKKFSLNKKYFAFVDTDQHLADQLFIKHKVRVNFGQEYAMPDTPYRVIMCSITKKDVSGFLAALKELENKMILMGHVDYSEFCTGLKKKMARSLETIRCEK